MYALTMPVVALNPAIMLARLTRNDRFVPCTVSWTRCTVSPNAPAACSSTAACSTPPRACSTSAFRCSVVARISLSNKGSSTFMRTNRYSDSATGFLSCINSGTSEPTSTANATAPHTGRSRQSYRLLLCYQASARPAGPPRAVLSKDTEYPEDDKQGKWNSQQPENERLSHDGPSFSARLTTWIIEHAFAGPALSEGWPGPLHAPLLAQGSPPILYESWDHQCRHR